MILESEPTLISAGKLEDTGSKQYRRCDRPPLDVVTSPTDIPQILSKDSLPA